MPNFGGLTKKKPNTQTQVASKGTGSAWQTSSDDKSQQRQKGNQSMLRKMHEQHGTSMIPRRKDLEAMLGEAKEDSFGGLKKNSTTYRPILNHLDTLNHFLDSTELASDADGMERQLDQALTLMGNLEKAVLHYVEVKKNNKKAKYMQRVLLPVIRNVRVSVIAKINRYKSQPPIVLPKWYIIASGELTRSQRVMDDSMKSRESASGAINTVDFYQVNASEEFVFKQNKDVIEDPDSEEHYVAGLAGIDPNNARFAKRNVAMYRLDKLLGGDLIPKTEFALRANKKGGSTQMGTIMKVAPGESAGKLGNNDRFVHRESDRAGQNKASGDGKQQPSVAVTDPTLQRCLSRLQLLDTLAFQVDRHHGNYYIEFDENGKVIGVKGIDNDMTFGKKESIGKFLQFPGVSRFVDKEMAERILALRNEDLEAALGDLLEPDEMKALLTRLAKLKQHLASAQLLEPHEWNEMTAKMMAEESKDRFSDNGSYFGGLYNAFLGTNKIKLD